MSEKLLIEFCSPTLANIKTGNLFSCKYKSVDELRNDISYLNKMVVPKGVRIIPMRYHNNRALIYVFRPSRLCSDFNDIRTSEMLTDMGYNCKNISSCIVMLADKIKKYHNFPHEIGLFLGYPPEDVAGFIENHGSNCKYTGCWKVYGDEKSAIKKFNSYKKCKDIYCHQWNRGASIRQLTVIG